MFKYSKRSQLKLSTCDERLQQLFNEVIKHRDCTVIWGHRGEEDQNRAFENGYSKAKWPDSEHNDLPSNATDVMPYHPDEPHIRWDDTQGLIEFANFVEGIAAVMGIKVRWGGRFKSFFDGAHWELM